MDDINSLLAVRNSQVHMHRLNERKADANMAQTTTAWNLTRVNDVQTANVKAFPQRGTCV
jgi:hypothetical protein